MSETKCRVAIFLGEKQVSHISDMTAKDAEEHWQSDLSMALKSGAPLRFPFDGKVALLNPQNILCLLVEEIEEEGKE